MTSDPILCTEMLSKRFSRGGGFAGRKDPGVLAVDEVSLEVEKGATLGIVGESGSGKSTLGRMIVGLTEPTSGRVLLDGAERQTMTRRHLHQRIQYVFQDPYSSLNPRQTIGQAIAVPLKHLLGLSRERRKERITELLELCGLRPEMAARYPHELSGGQRQRVVISRALAAQPNILILDEAVSALDVSIQAQILALLAKLQTQLELTYLFISHDLGVIETLSDSVVVMSTGKVVERGSRDAVFDRPREAYTRRLLNAVPGSRSGDANDEGSGSDESEP